MAEKRRSLKTHKVSYTMERAPPIEEVFQHEEVWHANAEVSYKDKGDILDKSTTLMSRQEISVKTEDTVPEKVPVQKYKKSDMKHSVSKLSKRKHRATKVLTRSDRDAYLPVKKDRSLQMESPELSTKAKETLLSVYPASIVFREEEETCIKTKGTIYVDVIELKTEEVTIEDVPIHQAVQSIEEHFVQKVDKDDTKDRLPMQKDTGALKVLSDKKTGHRIY